ncbi:MAG: N-acetyltransferase [Nitrospira sp.]|nr:MAG: N-acetyltransferase [Nitrospira sp.]
MRRTKQPFQQIAKDVKLGHNVKIFGFVNLYGCRINDDSRIGSFVEIQKGAVIGKRCKISSHSFICEGVTIGDEVFVGHHVVFINDKYPRATTRSGVLQTDADWRVQPIVVKSRASIGSGAVILGDVTIGERAIVGAGAVVTKDVPAGAVVAGNPARLLKASPSVRTSRKNR